MIEAEIRELMPQPTAAARMTQAMNELDLAALFDEHLPNIAHRLADMGIEPAARRTALPRVRPGARRRRDRHPGQPLHEPVALAEADPGEMAASGAVRPRSPSIAARTMA